MRPDGFRDDRRFVGSAALALLLTTTAPALASPFNTATVVGNAPLTIALGAAGFAVLALFAIKKLSRDSMEARRQAATQIAALRAQLDEYEALLAASREVTVHWTGQGQAPRILGQVTPLLPPGRRPEAILDFATWLADRDIDVLGRAVERLRVHGESFALDLTSRDGQAVRATGTILGGGCALRLRPAAEPAATAAPETPASVEPPELRALLAGLDLPAFRRNSAGRLSFANAAYLALAGAMGRTAKPEAPPELLEPALRAAQRTTLQAGRLPAPAPVTLSGVDYVLVEFPVGDGTAGYLRPQPQRQDLPVASGSRRAALVDILPIPVAIFDAAHQLVTFNAAYADLWKLGDWLKPGLDERTILDRLRREGLLPSEPDYRAWRSRHLGAYALKEKRAAEPWHLPDGRTLQVTAAPAGVEGGVIYLFEDISRELELVSQNRALASVQRSTLNALSEAVSVFGTNGRLQLFNPRLSALWKLPTNLLERNPHIDQMAEAVAMSLPEDGASIWRDLKRQVIDLSPTHADTSGRLTRSDGRLIDYAVVRLPDGQKLMTFLDVTESANYSRVLKERNDALVTADRLKDAFVQNVSYELRSPLTNIIGFADLLASPEVGPLNNRQHAYTDYIRASSVTLGVLIDNILDLATVDAGIAELRPEPQDVEALVEQARAGVAAAFPETGAGKSIHLEVTIAKDLPPFIADGTRIVQVLYNLMANAARFSEPGGTVWLRVSARAQRMLFVVEDEGAAISDEMRATLAERSEGTGSGRERGAGLGLAIVRAFVNLHGGTIAVEKREPRGSRVIVNLPRDASTAATAAE